MTTPPPRPGRDVRRLWALTALTAVGLVLGMVAAVTLSARALGPSPPSPQAPSATEPPLPASTCLTGGGVAIGAGDDAQSLVNTHPPGTTYLIKSGTHLRNFGIQPKSGDTFCGEPGAVLDGGRSLPMAFSVRA